MVYTYTTPQFPWKKDSCVMVEPEPTRANYKREVGKTFGLLTVLKYAGKDSMRRALFVCKCSCGKLKNISGCSLRSGHTKSCGCLHNEINRKPRGVSAFNRVFSRTKSQGIQRGYAFELSEEQFRSITSKKCYYCGVEPKQGNIGLSSGDYIYNGLDRVDNTRGYLLDNVVPCCITCNRAKDTMSIKQFVRHVENIYNTTRKYDNI